MLTIAIVGGGPQSLIPNLDEYKDKVTTWIGTDRGALTLIDQGISPDLAIGDFDSVTDLEQKKIMDNAKNFVVYPNEKDETDLELAILKAIEKKPDQIFLFGVTGGRLDHGMAAIQLLYMLLENNINGIIIDNGNQMEIVGPGYHEIWTENNYTNVSFIAFSSKVIGLSLEGFYYPLHNATVDWGSTLCISNKLLSEKGTFSFKEGILIVIKSRDVLILGS